MLIIEHLYDGPDESTATLTLSFEQRTRSRLRTTLDDGEDVGLFLPRGTVLRGGQRLLASDGGIVEVIAAPEALVEARYDSALELTRAAYRLGAYHAPAQVGSDLRGGWLRAGLEPGIEEVLAAHGCNLRRVDAPFEPDSGGWGGWTHPHDAEHHERRTPRIHEYRRPPATGASQAMP